MRIRPCFEKDSLHRWRWLNKDFAKMWKLFYLGGEWDQMKIKSVILPASNCEYMDPRHWHSSPFHHQGTCQKFSCIRTQYHPRVCLSAHDTFHLQVVEGNVCALPCFCWRMSSLISSARVMYVLRRSFRVPLSLGSRNVDKWTVLLTSCRLEAFKQQTDALFVTNEGLG